MMLSDLVLGIVFLIQTGVGILGNVFLLIIYISILLTGHRLRSIECIFAHLTLANSKVILSKGIPQLIACFGINNFLNLLGCKFIIYFQNVSRGVSLSITCLLSAFQVITISPSNSRCAELKIKASKSVVPACFFCWGFFLVVNFILLGTMHNSKYMNNNTKMWNMGYCSILIPSSFNPALFAIVFSIPDVICLGFMIWGNAYLVLFLHRHHQQVKHIHSSHVFPKPFPEKRATKAILLLVSTYVFFYSINSGLSIYLFKIDKHQPWFVPTLNLLAACFPAISPFILIFSDSGVLKYWYALWQRTPSFS